MLMAIDSNTGSEYEIKEGFERISDKPFVRCALWLNALVFLARI